MDHLEGKTFFDWNLTKGRFQINGYDKQFEKVKFLIREYGIRIKYYLEKEKEMSEESLKVKKNYEDRIRTAFNEESQIYQDKIQDKFSKMNL